MEKTYIAPDVKVINVYINPCMQSVSLGKDKADHTYKGGEDGNNDAKSIEDFDDDDTDW